MIWGTMLASLLHLYRVSEELPGSSKEIHDIITGDILPLEAQEPAQGLTDMDGKRFDPNTSPNETNSPCL